jgi:hypothetical protein
MEKCYTLSDVWLEFLYYGKKQDIVIVDVSNVSIRSDRILPLLQLKIDECLNDYQVCWDVYKQSVKFSQAV